jgi:hypothetical protein
MCSTPSGRTPGLIEVIAAKLAGVREGGIRRLIINLPPRHLKSLLASIARCHRGRPANHSTHSSAVSR